MFVLTKSDERLISIKFDLIKFFALCFIVGLGGNFSLVEIGKAAPLYAGCDAVADDQIYRFVEGVDDCLVPLSESELEALTDPFATTFLHEGVLPASPDALNEVIQKTLGYQPTVYLVGEGSQVPLIAAPREANRTLRYTIIWGENENDSQIMVSTLAPATGSPEMELMSFDIANLEYNYYNLRPQVSGGAEGEETPSVWAWVGKTSLAKESETMNNGCFRCHHNGLPVMRELELPWANWHSQRGMIASAVVPVEVASESFFLPRKGAEVLEGVVRGSFQNYYQAWLAQRTEPQSDTMDRLVEIDEMLRHLTTNTTVNFKSSDVNSANANTGPAGIDITGVPPRDTFLSDTLLQTVLGLDYAALSVTLPRDAYDAYLEEHNFRIEGTEGFFSGPVAYASPGSTHFAFYVPQIAAEDIYVAQLLLNSDVVTEKFVAAMLMVDYKNPLFSEKRESLQQYVATVTEGTVTDGESSVPADVVAAIEVTGAAACAADGYDDCSAEEQFLYTWNLPDDSWKETLTAQLQSYVDSINDMPEDQRLDHLMKWSVNQRDRLLATPRLCNFKEVSAHFPQNDLAQFPECPSDYAGGDATGASEDPFTFSTPGFVNDFLPSESAEAALMQQRWHETMNRFTDRVLLNDPWTFSEQPPEAISYFNPANTVIPDGAPVVVIPWTVFPNRIKFYYPEASRHEHWAYADDGPPSSPDPDNYGFSTHRDWQDEYGEWSVTRNDEGKITRVQFTTESREYWFTLWDVSPEAVLRLYRQLASPDVQLEDLYLRDDAGEPIVDPQTGRPAYDDFNKWNGQEGGHAVHMIAGFNYVYAGAMYLSMQSTVLREDAEGYAVTDPNQILNCSLHGTPNRNSDPFISGFITDLVRGAGVQITLEDPAGIYMQTPNFNLFQLPSNAPEGAHPSDYWTVTRGRARQAGETHDYILHAVYEVPEDQGFTVGDIIINGFPIGYGSQIAETINVAVSAIGMPKEGAPSEALSCVGDGSLPYPARLREASLLHVARRGHLTMKIEQGTTIENIALETAIADADTTVEFVDGPGVTAAVTDYDEESEIFTLTITATADAPLGDRSILLTNADGEGSPRSGLIEVVEPGTLGYSSE